MAVARIMRGEEQVPVGYVALHSNNNRKREVNIHKIKIVYSPLLLSSS
jgi:hypothetical protein